MMGDWFDFRLVWSRSKAGDMEPAFIVDYGHHDVKCGVTWLGKAASAKAARLAAATGNNHVVSCRSVGLANSTIASPDAVTDLLAHVCTNAFAATPAGAAQKDSNHRLAGSTVMLLTPIDMCRSDMETLAAIAFEGLGVKRLHIACSSAMGLLGSGVTTGVALDVGHYSSRVVAVSDGLPIPGAWRVVDRGGAQQTDDLQSLLHTAGLNESAFASAEAVTEAVMQAKHNAPWSMVNSITTCEERSITITLPDGTPTTLTVDGSHLDLVARSLYDTRRGRDVGQLRPPVGLLDSLAATLQGGSITPTDVGQQLVCLGGGSAVPGCEQLVASRFRGVASVRPIRDPIHIPWVGASILSQLNSFNAICVDKSAYDREGPGLIRACLT